MVLHDRIRWRIGCGGRKKRTMNISMVHDDAEGEAQAVRSCGREQEQTSAFLRTTFPRCEWLLYFGQQTRICSGFVTRVGQQKVRPAFGFGDRLWDNPVGIDAKTG